MGYKSSSPVMTWLARGRVLAGMLLLAAALTVAGGPAHAQSVDDLATAAQNPAPINVLEFDGGYKVNYRPGGMSEGFYRINYRGSLLDSRGTPFKFATHLDLGTPALTTGAGDRNRFYLRFERGTATAGGGLFEAEGVQPFTLRGLEGLHLRGTSLLTYDADVKRFQFAIGLETPPFRVPGFQRTQASNWIVFGINAQRQEDTEGGTGDKTVGLLTYRAFLGKAFGWRKSADVGRTAARIADEIFLKQAPTYATALELASKIRANNPDANKRTRLQVLFLRAVTETGGEQNWARTVKDITYGFADAITDQPTLALYVETSGWYTFAGSFDDVGLKHLVTVTIDYWFLPSRDDVLLRLRYENGYERATPTERKDQLLLSLAWRR